MTAAAGFKRLGIAIVGLVLAGCAVLGAMAVLISADSVREATKAEIRNVTGLDLVLGGDASVSLFPTGSVTFANVALGDGADPALAAEEVPYVQTPQPVVDAMLLARHCDAALLVARAKATRGDRLLRAKEPGHAG